MGSGSLTVAGKELRSYFKTPIAYVFLCAFLGYTGFSFFSGYLLVGRASMRGFFQLLPLVYLVFVPAVSMRMWAEERKIGTIETLLTMPIADGAIVFGKFLAALALVATGLALTFPIPIVVTLTAAGPVDFGPIIGGYLGSLLLAGAYLAICLFASALTENQIVAFILGVCLCLFFYIIGQAEVVALLPLGFGELLQRASLQYHFAGISRGVIDTRNIVYYVSMLTLFLLLNVAAVKRR